MAKKPVKVENLYSRGLDEACGSMIAARAAEREGNMLKMREELCRAVKQASELLHLIDMKALTTRKGN